MYGEFFPHIIRLDAKHSFMPCNRPFFFFPDLSVSAASKSQAGIRRLWDEGGVAGVRLQFFML